MPANFRIAAFTTLCGLLWVLNAGIALASEVAVVRSGSPSVHALQAEFLRRINQSKDVTSLFAPDALVPDFSGLRQLSLLPDKSLPQSLNSRDRSSLHVRLRAQLVLQGPFSSGCPAVDAHLALIGEDTRTWEESGWIELTYQHTTGGWLISELQYHKAD